MLTKVLIADDHAIVRHGLRQIVSETDDIRVEGEAESSAQAIRELRDNAFDVVLLDISLPDKNGIETLKQIRREWPTVAVLMLTTHAEDEFGVRAIKAGAAGYLTKQSAASQLVTAVRQVASGRKYISPSLGEELARMVGDGNDTRPVHELLSDREYQTFIMIASGKSLSEMATSLSLSPKTVSVYRSRVLEKMHLKNNVEIAQYAVKNGLVT
ncbi:MAG: response regulator transcription factor [Betaproteobacteria bacterium]|nr:MAG: response regulator transcription factor [Betaproteobacteria bacterium]